MVQLDLQQLKPFTAAEVADQAGPERVLVIVYDLVYDLTEFLELHPGGMEIIYEMVSQKTKFLSLVSKKIRFFTSKLIFVTFRNIRILPGISSNFFKVLLVNDNC